MGLLSRLANVFKALFGSWLRSIEDPVLILQQNMIDMNEQVPLMNKNISIVRANRIMLEAEQLRLETRSKKIEQNIRQSLEAGRRDIALQHASGLNEIRQSIQTNSSQLELSRKAYEHALEVKRIFLREKERKTREIIQAIRAAERARWQKQVAQVLESFELGDISQTHDEMLDRLREKTARDKAYLDVALQSESNKRAGSVADSDLIFDSWEAEEILKKFESDSRKTERSSPDNG